MNNNHGFTLLEVLISLFLLSLLVLGVTAIQASVLREARGSYYFHQAMLLAENMCEYLAANEGRFVKYERVWRAQMTDVLPNASGSVSGKQPSVAIKWGKEKTCDQNKIGVSGCVVIDCGH